MREIYRKQIRLPNFDYSSQGAYFVTICTHGRIPLFGQIVPDSAVGAALCGRLKTAECISKYRRPPEQEFDLSRRSFDLTIPPAPADTRTAPGCPMRPSSTTGRPAR